MAVYKVPQDVEAEDKLIGPFSFRQFIYLGIVAMGCAAAWGLFLVLKPLVVLPLPIIIFFGALALPLRKDQPMETYLAAMWQFYIKPRRRMWMADGVVSRITIDIPQVVERQLTKNITNDQAISQFDYLSRIADSGGWSTRGVTQAPLAVIDNPAEDILDGTSMVAQQFDTRLQQQTNERHEDLLARVQSGQITAMAPQPAPLPAQYAVAPRTAQSYVTFRDDPSEMPHYDPTPKYMQQQVIQPLGAQVPQPQMSQPAVAAAAYTSEPAYQQPVQGIPAPEIQIEPQNQPEPVASVATPAIMELAKGVSVETVAKQLHHEEVERTADGEILINLH